MAMLLHYSWMVLYVLIVMVAMLLARFTVTVVISMGYLPALEVDHPVLFQRGSWVMAPGGVGWGFGTKAFFGE